MPMYGGVQDQLIELQTLEQARKFNDTLIESIEETITDLLGGTVVNALYIHLEKVYSVSKDEIPNRLEALSSTLEKTFGVPSSRTISKTIARKLYAKLALPFSDNPSRTLVEFVEEAKIKLQEGESQL